jgi:DNA damage-binding protein 1
MYLPTIAKYPVADTVVLCKADFDLLVASCHNCLSSNADLKQVEGSIYLFGLITHNYQNLLMTLQSNLAELMSTPGNVPFAKYRAFKNQVREAEEPYRFVDGDLVERFLDESEEVQTKAVEGLGVDVESMKAMIEGLRRLH